MHRTGFKHDAAQNRNATHTCVQICHFFWVGRGVAGLFFVGFFLMVREVCALFGCCQVHYSGFPSTSSPPSRCGFGRGSAGVGLFAKVWLLSTHLTDASSLRTVESTKRQKRYRRSVLFFCSFYLFIFPSFSGVNTTLWQF